jgi:FkbM family methyltransferase
MNATLRRMIVAVPGMERPYKYLRKEYSRFRLMRQARRCFTNVDDFREAMFHPVSGQTRDIHTKDGLSITIRQNNMDAGVLAEVWLEREYVRGYNLRDRPVVVDVGGFIGDFAIFAVKYLNASRVVVAEPSPANWALLVKNTAANHYTDRITALHMAVTDGRPVMMDVDAPEAGQARVSAYWSPQAKLVEVPGISLAKLVIDQGLSDIDLLKIDCEGGEYLILETAPKELLHRVHNIVFEFHEIQGFSGKLAAVKLRLRNEGFTIRTRGSMVFASRQSDAA